MARIGISLALILMLALAIALPGQAQEFRGFWADAWHYGYENATATQTMVDYIKGCNSNAVIVEVRKRGDAYYASTLEPRGINMTPAAGYDCLADVCARAHAQGLEVHAWVVVYRVWTSQTAPATTSPDHVFNTHPEWFNLTNTGAKFDSGNNSFLDPGHPGVESFNNDVFMEIVRDYDIDGICLDYIRYPGTAWGYNPTSVARYNAEYGTTGNPSYLDTRWSNWRRDQITNMVKRTYLEAKAIKPGIKVGAAVWKTSPTGDSGYFQNWDLWMQNHWLDYACPMNYTTTNSTYDSNNADNYGRMYGRHIYPAQGSYMNTISNSMIQIMSTQNMGFQGITPYSYAVTNSGTVDRAGFQSALLSGPFAAPQSVPEMQWITGPLTGMMKGFVKDVNGNVVYPATVTISGKSTKNSGTGFYGFVDLAPGTYTVSATAPNQPSGTGTVSINAGQVATLDITLGTVDNEAPTVPAGLNAVAESYTAVNLTWTASTDNIGVAGYKVYRNGVQIGTSTSTVYSDTNCAPGTTYTYEVSAYDDAGNESAKSAPAVTATPADTTAPSVPADLSASVASQTQIHLTWAASTDNVGVTGYKVYRDGVQIGASATTAYSDTTCTSGVQYTYEVSAYDAAGNESAKSTPVAVTIPGITVKSYAPSSITLTKGSVASGGVANLAANDGSYLVINGAAKGKTYTIDWYSTAVIAEVPASISKLTITFDGKQSASVTRTLFIYNWANSSWTQIDARTVGTTDVTSTWTTSTPANYISGSGQIRLRQYSTRKGTLSSSSDFAQFTVEF